MMLGHLFELTVSPFSPCLSGIFGLGRKFKIMDDDGSKSISFSEFTKALAETEVPLDAATMRNLFTVCVCVCCVGVSFSQVIFCVPLAVL